MIFPTVVNISTLQNCTKKLCYD